MFSHSILSTALVAACLSVVCAAPTPQAAAPAGGSFSGQATYYAPGMGACGKMNTDGDMIVAISHTLFDSTSSCGKAIHAQVNGGPTVTVTVADRCEACAEGDLDFTSTGFTAVVPGGLGVGRASGLTWSWA